MHSDVILKNGFCEIPCHDAYMCLSTNNKYICGHKC